MLAGTLYLERYLDTDIMNLLRMLLVLYTVSQKSSHLKLSVTLSNLNRFSKPLHCWKVYEMCYLRHYLPHLRHVATLTWEIKNLNFLQIFNRYGKNANRYHFIATNFVIRLQILIFSSFKIASFSAYTNTLSIHSHTHT